MLVIRLSRVGKRKQPSYRVVVQEKGRDPWGKALSILGNYNPRTKALIVRADEVKEWIGKGAQPTATVHNLLVNAKIVDAPKMKNAVIEVRKPSVAPAVSEVELPAPPV